MPVDPKKYKEFLDGFNRAMGDAPSPEPSPSPDPDEEDQKKASAVLLKQTGKASSVLKK